MDQALGYAATQRPGILAKVKARPPPQPYCSRARTPTHLGRGAATEKHRSSQVVLVSSFKGD
jgi:hypothetical protein